MTATLKGQDERPPLARRFSTSAVGLLHRHRKYKCMHLAYLIEHRLTEKSPVAHHAAKRSRLCELTGSMNP